MDVPWEIYGQHRTDVCDDRGHVAGFEFPQDAARAVEAVNSHASLQDRVKRLTASLREQFCPRPCNHRPSQFDVGDCVDAGECGCSAVSALQQEQSNV